MLLKERKKTAASEAGARPFHTREMHLSCGSVGTYCRTRRWTDTPRLEPPTPFRRGRYLERPRTTGRGLLHPERYWVRGGHEGPTDARENFGVGPSGRCSTAVVVAPTHFLRTVPKIVLSQASRLRANHVCQPRRAAGSGRSTERPQDTGAPRRGHCQASETSAQIAWPPLVRGGSKHAVGSRRR